MKVVISPSKTMQGEQSKNVKVYNKQKSMELYTYLQSMNEKMIESVFKVTTKKASDIYKMHQQLDKASTAITSYSGIAFKYLQASVWTSQQCEFATKHLFVLSALHGVECCDDLIPNYRLDFTTRNDLYDFWKDDVECFFKNDVVLNLASKEYSKLIENCNKIDVNFLIEENGKRTQKATYSKMARGAMAKEIIMQQIDNLDDVKKIKCLGFCYDDMHSTSTNLCYVLKKNKD